MGKIEKGIESSMGKNF